MANGKKTLAIILLLELCGSKVSIRTGDTKTCPGYYLSLLFYFCLAASEKDTWNFLYEHFWCRRMKYITAHHKSSQEWRQNSSVHYKSSNFKYTETSKISYNLIQLHPSVFNKRNCIFNSNINLISAILKQFKSSEDKGSICDWNLKKKKSQEILSEELVLPHTIICSIDTDIYVCAVILRECVPICHLFLQHNTYSNPMVPDLLLSNLCWRFRVRLVLG